MAAHCLVYSTHPSPEQARATAAHLLNASLAACCNMLPAMESHYIWEGKATCADEVVLLTKTTAAAAPAAMQAIAQLHPYDCPAILQLPVEGGHEAFLAWLDSRCSPHPA